MKTIHLCMLFLILILLFPMCASNAQLQQQEGIQLLRLKFTKDSIEFIESTVSEGSIKTPRSIHRTHGIQYEVVGTGNDIMWRDVMDNPLLQRVEYVDDDGELRSMLVEKQEAEVFIRIPYYTDARAVQFYILEDKTASVHKDTPSQRFLGRVDFP